MLRWVTLAALACLSCACAQVRRLPGPAQILPPEEAPDARLHLSVAPYFRAGPADGYLQTPRGGKFGTTDIRRPTLSEIGVGGTQEAGARLDATWKRHGLTLEWSRLFLGGDDTLHAGLTTQAAFFPSGTDVTSDSFLTYLGFNYSYLHELRLGAKDRVQLRPGFGARFVDVAYELRGSNGAVADRTYTSWGPLATLDWSWRPRGEGNLLFSGRVSTTLDPFLSEKRRMYVFEASGRMHYEFRPRVSAFLETGYRHSLLDDTQPDMSNRIHVDFGPWIGLGVTAGF